RALVDAIANRAPQHGAFGPLDGARAAHAKREGIGGPMGHLLHGLDLTDAQRTSIESALAAQRPAPPDHEAMKKRFEAMHTEMRAKLESFVSDTFDAKAFATPPEKMAGEGPKEHLARFVNDLSVIVPLLDPAQREKLAAEIEKGPRPMGPHGERAHHEHARRGTHAK